MKISRKNKVVKSKYGKIIFTNNNLEPHERDTIFCLSSFGLDIETLIPSDIPNSRNPDILMLGTYWEIKGGATSNWSTIQTKFRKATKQSGGRAIFDLRTVRIDKVQNAKETILKMFQKTREMRRIIIILDDDNLLDILK